MYGLHFVLSKLRNNRKSSDLEEYTHTDTHMEPHADRYSITCERVCMPITFLFHVKYKTHIFRAAIYIACHRHSYFMFCAGSLNSHATNIGSRQCISLVCVCVCARAANKQTIASISQMGHGIFIAVFLMRNISRCILI